MDDTLRFRAFWALLAAADYGSTNQAARALNLTQPAVSHAIKLIEERLGVVLFNRRSKGMVLTELGEVFCGRVRRAMNLLLAAETEIARSASDQAVRDTIRGLHRRITRQQLVTLVSVAERRSVQYASQDTGYSQSVVWHALRELRGLVGEPLVEHRPSGISLSASGEVLVRYAKLAFAELRFAHSDLAAVQGNLSGRVMVGALALSSTYILPRAIAQMSSRYPNLEFTMVDGPYSTLLSALRCGDLDVIVGALRNPAPAPDVTEEVLFREPLAIVAGVHNPLVKRSALTLRDVADHPWVLPCRSTPSRVAPTRNLFEALFLKNDVTPPRKIIESSSLSATRALLLDSNYLTLISPGQVHYDLDFGILAALRVDGLADTERAIGVTTRSDASVSPGVRELIRRLHMVSHELERPSAAPAAVTHAV